MRRETKHPFGDRFRTALLAASFLLGVALTGCYALRPDSLAAVTIWPVWVWFCVGIWLSLAALGTSNRRKVLIISALWFVFLLAFADEPHSLVRAVLPSRVPTGANTIRLVSLNCSGGAPLAAGEVAAYGPDVVLLQESPSERDVQALSRRLYGDETHCVRGPDASVLARGAVTPVRVSAELTSFISAARVTPASGEPFIVVSLRLLPQTVRLDFWSPGCRRQYSGIRVEQREQLRLVWAWLEQLKPGMPVIIGGDFNAPQHDGIFSVFQPKLHEAFVEAGVGWGNTIINEAPMLRIDQVWLSEGLTCVRSEAKRTIHSDHRLVVSDVAFPHTLR